MSRTPSPNDPQFDELRRLLAAKRAERPPQETMDGFLGEFHKRLADEQIAAAARRANSWWLRLRERLGVAPAVPGDEAFPALRRLLALKRYERPSPAYLDNFLMRLNRRMLAGPIRPAAFWTWVRQSLATRPLAVAQVGVAFALMLTIHFYDRGQDGRAPLVAQTPPPVIVAAASPERQVNVIYDDARAVDAPDGSVVMLPAGVTHPQTHFVMDHVDVTPKVYAVSFNY
jgi:hypothetical protein